tara:strand:- start:1558 stop:2382 length:825 start_codon:yes stop_codon:yes gene_type:complete
MAKRTYNRRKTTAKKPVTSDKGRKQRIKGAQTARKTGSKDKMTISGQRSIKGGPRGAQGPATPPQQGPSRRTPTAISGDTGRRIPENKYGTKGTPKSGPPGTGKPPRFDPRIRTATPKAGALTRTAAQMIGLSIADKLAQTAGKRGQSRMSKLGIQGPAKPKRKMSNIPAKEGTGKGSPNDRKPAVKGAKQASKTGTRTPITRPAAPKTAKAAAPKVAPKKKPQKLSGIGPVKSGQGYATAVTGKSKSQRAAEELRAMQKRSRERQAAQKKKKK